MLGFQCKDDHTRRLDVLVESWSSQPGEVYVLCVVRTRAIPQGNLHGAYCNLISTLDSLVWFLGGCGRAAAVPSGFPCPSTAGGQHGDRLIPLV
jgi:hypothetical protein